MDSRISILKKVTPWNVPSYSAYVDSSLVGEYRYKKDAIACAKAHIIYLKERDDSLWKDLELEFDAG